MAKPRIPLSVALVSGALAKNPQRYRARVEPAAAPLGDPPDWMTAGQRVAWVAFRAELPWLNASHAALLEVAATLRARIVEPDCSTSTMALLRLCAGQMGAPR